MIQKNLHQPVMLGDTAPDFTANTTMGKISFHEWIGDSWCIFLSHPKDFTPVCTTELGRLAKLKGEFDKRTTKILTLSEDSVDNHRKWINDINETQGTMVNFPLIGDESHEISELYGMIHPLASETTTVRCVFIIDPKKKVRESYFLTHF